MDPWPGSVIAVECLVIMVFSGLGDHCALCIILWYQYIPAAAVAAAAAFGLQLPGA